MGFCRNELFSTGVFFAELLKGIDLGSLVDNDVDLKIDDFNQNVLLMSPPASDSGSQAGFSELGSPSNLLKFLALL